MIKCPNTNTKIRQMEKFENVEIFQLFQITGAKNIYKLCNFCYLSVSFVIYL